MTGPVPHYKRPALIAVVAVVVAVSAAACSWTTDGATEGSDDGAAASAIVGAGDADDPAEYGSAVTVADVATFASPDVDLGDGVEVGPGDTLRQSPIDELLGLEGDPIRLSEQYAEQDRLRVEHMNRCMAEDGFDDFMAWGDEIPSPEDLMGDDPTLHLAKVGYGPTIVIRSRYDSLGEQPSDEAAPGGVAGFLDEHPELDGPAFYQQLTDCNNEAWDAYPPPNLTFPQQLVDEVNQLRNQARASAPAQKAWSDWSRCMAAEGYEMSGRDGARGLVQEAGSGLFVSLDQWAADGHVPTADERTAFEAELDELAEFERGLVALDLACAEASEVDDITEAEIDRAELAWIDTNGARVELVLAEQQACDGPCKPDEPVQGRD